MDKFSYLRRVEMLNNLSTTNFKDNSLHLFDLIY